MVGGKLTHLVGLSGIGVLEGHGQHLVRLQGRLQRDVAQGGIVGVLRGVQQACRCQLFVVLAS